MTERTIRSRSGSAAGSSATMFPALAPCHESLALQPIESKARCGSAPVVAAFGFWGFVRNDGGSQLVSPVDMFT